MWITRLAVRRPVSMIVLLVSLLVLGGISVLKLPLSFLPNEELPFIGVFVPYPNGIPGQVEREIARPIEEVLSTLGGVKEIFSQSDPEQCFVGVEFDWGRDVNLLRLEVKEKLDQIRPELPADVRDVLLFTFNTNDIPIVEGRISARGRDLSGSYDLIERRIVNRLQRVPGVGRVQVEGVEPADVSVYLELDRIKEHRVDVGRLFTELSSSNFNLTVGQVTSEGLRYNLRSVGALGSVADIENLPLDDRGLRLRDVAKVVAAEPELTYGRLLNREPAVAFWVQKASGANTVEVVDAVKAELERINRDPALAGIEVLLFFDQGDQITNSLNGLLSSGAIGAGLAVAVLYFFLLRIGTTLIISLAIPISIVGTAAYLFATHRSLNILSMMGLMLGVGMLIDNAVVVLESIYRRMSLGEDPETATLKGTEEVGRAVVSATLTSVIVFAPILFGGKSEITTWLKEVGITITVTLLLSLLVSLTLIPLLTTRILKGGRRSVARNPWVGRWADGYERALRWTAVRHPWVTGVPIALGVIALTLGLAAVTKFKPDILGDEGVRQEYLQITYDFQDNVDYQRARVYVDTLEAALWAKQDSLGLQHLYSFYQDNYAMTRVYFRDGVLEGSDLGELRKQTREGLPTMAGVELRFGDDEGQQSGAKQFSVTLYGEDSEELADMATEAKRRLMLLPDAADVTTDLERGAEEVQVRVDPERARRLGLSPGEVAQVMAVTFRGVQLPRVHADGREIDLWVSLRPEDRRNLDDLRSLVVGAQDGREILLGQVATTVMDRGANRINRQDQKTAVTVRGALEGENSEQALEDVRGVMDSIHFPPGYGWNFGTEIRQAREQQSEMLVNVLLALLCVYMVMASLFESFVHPAVVMFCIPFAGLGVIWLMVATGAPFNLMAMIGMVILVGVVVNNGIVLVAHINQRRREGLSLDEAILSGGRERFRPIMMTATTTILGLIPLAVGNGHVGDLKLYPMALALIGGLASSTALTLILLPVYYQLTERLRVRWGLFFTWSGRLLRRFGRRLTGRALHGTAIGPAPPG